MFQLIWLMIPPYNHHLTAEIACFRNSSFNGIVAYSNFIADDTTT